MSSVVVKCRKCRYTLLTHPESPLITAHGDYITSKIATNGCSTLDKDHLWYLNADFVPPWIQDIIDQVSWQKGKLNCPHCQARVGTIDFVSGLKCACGTGQIPPIQLVKSKLDNLTPLSLS